MFVNHTPKLLDNMSRAIVLHHFFCFRLCGHILFHVSSGAPGISCDLEGKFFVLFGVCHKRILGLVLLLLGQRGKYTFKC